MRFQPPWSGAFRLQSYVNRTPEALPADTVEAIRAAILGSPLLGESNLSEQFTGTYGFSCVFRRDALPDMKRRFPAFGPFLDAALLPDCNAFLLNPLLVQRGRTVEAHIDRTLSFYGAGYRCPVAVSVLYVQVPEGLEGGELRLYHRGQRVAQLKPMPRSLVTFRGDMVHEVTPVTSGVPGMSTARISLVVEQYRVPADVRVRIPRLDVLTRAQGAAA
jgi:hypothetical protein